MTGTKDSPKMEVTDYFMSVHFGLCHGPIDAIHRIIVKEKEAWKGYQSVQGPITVSRKDLFGGNKKEGGVDGIVEFLPGGLDQLFPNYLASRFNRTQVTMPSYRGMATCFFTNGSGMNGGRGQKGAAAPPYANQGSKGAVSAPPWPEPDAGSELPLTGNESYGFSDITLDRPGGFMWASNNPYLPDTWIRASRAPKPEALAAELCYVRNFVPEAIIGAPETPEENEDDDDENDVEPNAEREDPLNGYYIGDLPSDTQFYEQNYEYGTAPESVYMQGINYADDGSYSTSGETSNLAKLLYTQQQKLKLGADYDGLIYRDYGIDANPCAVILEAMTNPVWGMGAPTTLFDIASFQVAALQLRDERFGVSVQWAQQSTIEDMVKEMLDHIQATLFVHPRTGLFTIKLLRDDYDAANLRELNPDNANLRSFQRKAWGDTVNEIVVTWTNPENEKESTVTLQDLANIAIQGGIVSDSRNYYGVRNAALAMRLCARDLRTASVPTASFEADLDRNAWDIVPGEVVRVVWPEDGIENAVFRIMDVDYGRIGQSTIKVKFVEDMFALPTQGYSVPSAPRPTPENRPPSPLEYMALLTVPYQLASRFGYGETMTYPDAGVLFLGATRNNSVESFTLLTPEVLPTGETIETAVGTPAVTTHVILPNGLPKEFVSTVSIFSARTRDGGLPAPGGLLVIGDTDAEHEICMFSNFAPETGYTFQRGMLDTVPREWPANTPAWVIEYAVFNGVDGRVRTIGVEVDYKVLTKTSTDETRVDNAQLVSFTPGDRPYAPARPANCKVDGQPFIRTYTTRPTSPVPISWANRNRKMEDAVFRAWTDGEVTPETGQTTTIRVLNEGGEVELEVAGLAGSSSTIDVSGLSGGAMRVQFWSERDGYESIQAYEVILAFPYVPGYGYGYGGQYGE